MVTTSPTTTRTILSTVMFNILFDSVRMAFRLGAGKGRKLIGGELAMAGLAAIHQARVIEALQFIIFTQCRVGQFFGSQVECAVQREESRRCRLHQVFLVLLSQGA